MIGYFIKKDEGNGLMVMIIPSNLVVYEKGSHLEISFDPNMLEDLNIELIRDKEEGNLEKDIKRGKIQLIDVDDNFLNDFRNRVSKNESQKANVMALELYKYVRSINTS